MTFDPVTALATLRTYSPQRPGRKLSFPDQCGLYSAREAASHAILAKAFGVTKSTVSQITNAKATRYPRIAEELEKLGQLEFDRRYYTEEIHARIVRLRADRAEIGDDRTQTAPNPRADKFGEKTIGSFRAGELTWRIRWIDGWWATPCHEGEPTDHQLGVGMLRPENGGQPFRTSADAHRAIILDAQL